MSPSIIEIWKANFAEILRLPTLKIVNGLISQINYNNENNERHRIPLLGPATIWYEKNGDISIKEYRVNNKKHNLDGPASIGYYYKTGVISYKEYWVDNKLHRLDGPAEINYHENGQIFFKTYYSYGINHRLDGPAYITYDENGNITCKENWINGVEK